MARKSGNWGHCGGAASYANEKGVWRQSNHGEEKRNLRPVSGGKGCVHDFAGGRSKNEGLTTGKKTLHKAGEFRTELVGTEGRVKRRAKQATRTEGRRSQVKERGWSWEEHNKARQTRTKGGTKSV